MIMRKYEHKVLDAAFYSRQRDEEKFSEGKAEEKVECASKLIGFEAPMEMILQVTGLSKEQFDEIRASMRS
ncbi:MAG: hypothetical protein LBR22_02730 [Desulfovibrio sp.]|jgi:hypothetical protein|nr:hypothetical protein [Desulfovibrio sp.]